MAEKELLLGKNQRRHTRYPVQWSVRIRAAHWEEARELATGNVSRGGVFVRCAQPPELGTRLDIVLDLPDGMTLRAGGEVVHVVTEERASAGGLAAGFGLRFDERHALDLGLVQGLAATHVGTPLFHPDENYPDENYLTLPAQVFGRGATAGLDTTAHQLLARREEAPATEHTRGPLAQSPAGAKDAADSDEIEILIDTPPEDDQDELSAAPAARSAEESRAPAVPLPPLTDAEESCAPAVIPPAPTDVEPSRATAPESRAVAAEPPPAPESRAVAAEPPPAPERPELPGADAGQQVFGVDFGTSYTSIALVQGNQVRVLEDEEGQSLIPSVVCYPEEGPALVGWPAREKMAHCPATTFVSPKRLLGRTYTDRRLEAFLSQSAVRYDQGPQGSIVAQVRGETLAMPQVCAEVFRRASQMAEHACGAPVRRVVLSAPVGYSGERAALLRAARLAGLEVLETIDEPVAAALAYGLGRTPGQTVAVYDFGGGTFDFTLLRFKAGGGFEILGEAGDPWLGGDDFDLALATYAANQFWRQYKVELRERVVEWQRLLFLCESAKRKLSTEEETLLRAPAIVLSLHGPLNLEVPLSRELFTRLCGELIDRSLETVASCLELAGVELAEIDHVVLTGGVSRSRLVRQRVQEYFRREIPITVDPEQAIVMGNALYGRFVSLRSAGVSAHPAG